MLPDWLDLGYSENAACAMYRGLRGLSAGVGELVADAQAVMSCYQEFNLNDVTSLYDEPTAVPLIAAARILDLLSRMPMQLVPDQRAFAGLSSAVAYGMYGNFASSYAAIKSVIQKLPPLTPSIAVVVATVAPGYLPMMFSHVASAPAEQSFLQELSAFLSVGDEQHRHSAAVAFDDCLAAAATPYERSLLMSSRVALEHQFQLSIMRVLGNSSATFVSGYLERLRDAGLRVLFPTQFKAITQFGLLDSKENFLIGLPTK